MSKFPPQPSRPVYTRLKKVKTVKLVVGKKEEWFEVHYDRLFAASSWFKTALNSGFKESGTGEIALPEDDEDVIEFFIEWLYSMEYVSSNPRDYNFMLLAKLYEFAERLMISDLKNHVIWHLCQFFRDGNTPPHQMIDFVCEELPSDSPLRRLLVKWFTCNDRSARKLKSKVLKRNGTFAAELVLSMVKKSKNPKKFTCLNPKDYYEDTIIESDDEEASVT